MNLKRISLYLALIFPLVYTGCTKEESNPYTNATSADFIGTWRGTVTAFKHNQKLTKTGDIIFYYEPDGITVSGLFVTDQLYVLRPFQLRNGVFYFQVLNSDTLNPFCLNWNLQGMMELTGPQDSNVYLYGKECGDIGEESVGYEGRMERVDPNPLGDEFYSFGKQGNRWKYSIVLKNGDSCQSNVEVSQALGYLCTVLDTNDCGWTTPGQFLGWNVTPLVFSVMTVQNSTPQYSFFLDARLDIPYYFYPAPDTNIVTLVAAKEEITVPAGSFECQKFRLEKKQIINGYLVVDAGYYWISKAAGIIRYESLSWGGSGTDIQSQVLISRKF